MAGEGNASRRRELCKIELVTSELLGNLLKTSKFVTRLCKLSVLNLILIKMNTLQIDSVRVEQIYSIHVRKFNKQ